MSFGNVLNIARSALFSQQRAMTVTARNIANAQTPGYTRQKLHLQNTGLFGGVSSSVSRERDLFLDANWRRQSSDYGATSTHRYFLDQVEAATNEPSDSGVSAAIDGLFRAFGSLADDPTSDVAREEVRGAAQRFVHHLRRLGQSLDQASTRAVDRLEAEVDEVNTLSERIAALNEKILNTSQAGSDSFDLMDERDRLIDQLSSLTAIEVVEARNGTYTVMTGGVTLVSGSNVQKLEMRSLGEGRYGVGSLGSAVELGETGGSLSALGRLVSTTLPDMQVQLDRLAADVVGRVNELHRQGTNARGETGVDFFDPDGVTAVSIGLSDAVNASSNAIAAGRGNGSGDNTLALELAALGEEDRSGLDGRTFGSYYAVFVSALGRSTRDAAQDESAATALLDNAEAWRQGISGVSVEEEMVSLISQQEAYTAAARLVNVADGMVQEILRLGQ